MAGNGRGKSKRGFAAMDPKKQKEIARKGGEAEHSERGLEAADEKTRQEVAKKGGEASKGGGRRDEEQESS